MRLTSSIYIIVLHLIMFGTTPLRQFDHSRPSVPSALHHMASTSSYHHLPFHLQTLLHHLIVTRCISASFPVASSCPCLFHFTPHSHPYVLAPSTYYLPLLATGSWSKRFSS